jgi:hypothetical protein
MKVVLKRIPPMAAAKVAAVIYGLFSLIFVPFALLGALAGAMSGAGNSQMAAGMGLGFGMMIIFPIFYVVGGFLMTLLACAIYNLVEGWVGGIQLVFEEKDFETFS